MNIYDIALEAGVSISTVSRVLNNKKNVSPKTVEKVRGVMKKNNYTPNSNARALVMNTTQTIGIITVDIRGSHYANVAHAVLGVFNKFGYNCVFCNAGRTPEEQQYFIELLLQNKLDGLLFVGSVFESPTIESLIKDRLSHVPIVMVNGNLDLPNVYSVSCKEEDGITDAIEHLCLNDHKKIAFVKSDRPKKSDTIKENAYLDVINRYGLKPFIYQTEDKITQAVPVTEQILDDHPDISAIMYSTDTMAAGGLKTVTNRGLNVPNDVEIIGFNNSEVCEILTPTLTSVDNQAEQLGTHAARILYDVMEGRKTSKKLVLIPELVFRESTVKKERIEIYE